MSNNRKVWDETGLENEDSSSFESASSFLQSTCCILKQKTHTHRGQETHMLILVN